MTTYSSTIYRPGLAAAEVHDRLRRSVADLRAAERNAVLWFADVLSRRLYRDLGYATIHHYATDALGFSKAKISQFIRLSASLGTLPKLRQAVASGQISWTKAREVVAVATPKTEARWVADARQGTRRELEQKVAKAKEAARALRSSPAARQQAAGQQVLGVGAPAARGGLALAASAAPGASATPGAWAPRTSPPVEVAVSVQLRFTPVQYARFEQLVAKARSLGLRGSREEMLLAALETELRVAAEQRARPRHRAPGSGTASSTSAHPGLRERVSSRSPYPVVVDQCATCRSAHAPTSEGEKPIAPATIGAIRCDAQLSSGGKRMRATIAPRLRRRVLERDGYRCRMAGCGSTRHLCIHHRVPLAFGGTDDVENLVTLCERCHRWVHEKLTLDVAMAYA
jgi:hypothetical protein